MLAFSRVFHVYHLFSFLTSVLAYLFSTFLNSSAARYGFTFTQIGLLNLLWSTVYAFSSISLGHVGDRIGYKSAMRSLYIYALSVSVFGFFVRTPPTLVVFAILQAIFFGAFFPEIEGLIAKSEEALGINPPSITGRFTLSWSTGNMLGVAFGPFLTVKLPALIFIYGIAFSSAAILFLTRELAKNRDSLSFVPDESLKLPRTTAFHTVSVTKDRMKALRLEYRLILLLGGVVYTSVLAHFPKIIATEGIPLSSAGFLTVGANVGVVLMFFFLQRWHAWVGNETVSSLLLLTIPATGLLTLLPSHPVSIFFVALTAGFSYAVPYTFAIFYGLLSESEGQGKQGAIHEMVIGLLFGFGPFVGGLFLESLSGKLGLTALSFVVTLTVFFVQLVFRLSKSRVKRYS